METIKKPHLFYKYHSINTNLFKLLTNSALWFSSRRELNDLFEGRFNVSDDYITETIEEATEIFFQEMQSQLPLFYQMDSKRFFQIIYATLKDKKILDELFNSNFFYSEANIEWFVCCFTTKLDNNIMWAHYAESHKGVCLEFDFSKDKALFEKIYLVQYSEEIPVIKNADDLKIALLTKKNDWSYEDEWRILANTGGSKSFNKECLTTIYFGNRSSKEDVLKVMTFCKEHDYVDIEFRRNNGKPFKTLSFKKQVYLN